MNQNLEDQMNPFQILDVPFHPSETDIQQAWQAKMKQGGDVSQYVKAYAMIRDQNGRNQQKWDEIYTFLTAIPTIGTNSPIDLTGLIHELAFLSPWELGDDKCQN